MEDENVEPGQVGNIGLHWQHPIPFSASISIPWVEVYLQVGGCRLQRSVKMTACSMQHTFCKLKAVAVSQHAGKAGNSPATLLPDRATHKATSALQASKI